MKKIGIITVNYYSSKLIKRLIGFLIKQTYDHWVLVVVNNSGTGDNIEEVIEDQKDNRIFLLDMNENIGFARANNEGCNYLIMDRLIDERDIILFINPDIMINEVDFLSRACNKINKETSFFGPKITNTDGTYMIPHMEKSNYFRCMLHIGNNGVVDRLLGLERKFNNIYSTSEVFLINGACFFCRPMDFKNVGMFDSNTFLYYEEELLFRKARALGLKVFYDPSLEVLHEHSAVIERNLNLLKKKKILFDSELYFLREILKCNRLKISIFRFERFLELIVLRIFFKIIKNKYFSGERFE